MTGQTEQVTYQYIVKTPGTMSGRARIAGRRIRVQDVYGASLYWGWSPDRICDEYDLTLGQVHAALAYAYDHLDEIRADMQADDELYEKLKAESPPTHFRQLWEKRQQEQQGE